MNWVVIYESREVPPTESTEESKHAHGLPATVTVAGEVSEPRVGNWRGERDRKGALSWENPLSVDRVVLGSCCR